MATRARKTKTTETKNPTARRAIDDNFQGQKMKPRDKSKDVSLAEALAEAGQTMDDLRVESDPAPVRPAGASNLANTIRAHRGKYGSVTAPGGRKTQNNGDSVAAALMRITLPNMTAFVAERLPGTDYSRLNPGHQRMCLGNRIRAWAKQGDQTTLLWLETAQTLNEIDATVSADELDSKEEALAEAQESKPKARKGILRKAKKAAE